MKQERARAKAERQTKRTGRKYRPHIKRFERFNWHRAMFVLPNLFTLSSIFCGLYAMTLASGEARPQQLSQAALAIFFGIFFDMADGRVARLTKTQSDFGIQLDSIADVITFGAAPAVLIYKWGLVNLGFIGVLAAFIYIACGALRLARFNVLASRSTGSKKFFIGLPIPLAAGVIVSLVLFHQTVFATNVVRTSNILVLLLVLSYLMVSNIRYRSFKDLRLSPKILLLTFFLVIAFSVIAASIQPTFALLSFFSAYVLLGLLEEIIQFIRSYHTNHVVNNGNITNSHTSNDSSTNKSDQGM
ncbi:MAG: CDP-diacylglycerol--serine O-phosphatidyltransferase [Deltaproteobacteria bacterium]|nr:CDP-diacylglycerol--serine O-phosphatidyltransferase [Deltaproteobacteria bacterium]